MYTRKVLSELKIIETYVLIHDPTFYKYSISTQMSVAVGRWTRDQEVAGSTPTAALLGQQSWCNVCLGILTSVIT